MAETNQSVPLPSMKVGERYWFRLEPRFAGEGPYKPSSHPGMAYLFALPFDIQVDRDLSDPISCALRDLTVRLYPPFRMDDRTGDELEQVPLERIPYAPSTSAPTGDHRYQKTFSVGRSIAPSAVVANAIRLDFYPNPELERASEVASQLIGLIRWWTQQWWVGRDRRYAEAMLRNAFAVDSQGERVAGVHSYAYVYAGLNTASLLDREKFSDIGQALILDWRIPLSADFLFDAVYFHAIGDLRRSILDAATACERIRDEAVERLLSENRIPQSSAKRYTEGTDLLKHISTGFQNLIGRSFLADEPEVFERCRRLWAARGNVAHGNPPVAPFPEGARPVTSDDQFRLILAVFRLLEWATKV